MTRRDVRIRTGWGSTPARRRASSTPRTASARGSAPSATGGHGRQVDPRILLLAASQGTELELEADGEDEEEALEALGRLVEGGFGEELRIA